MKVVLAFFVSFSFGFTLMAQPAMWQRYFDSGTMRQVVPVSENQNEGYFMAYESSDGFAQTIRVIRIDTNLDVIWDKEFIGRRSGNDTYPSYFFSRLYRLTSGNLAFEYSRDDELCSRYLVVMDKVSGETISENYFHNIHEVQSVGDTLHVYFLHNRINCSGFYRNTPSYILLKYHESQIVDFQTYFKDTIDYIKYPERDILHSKIIDGKVFSLHRNIKDDGRYIQPTYPHDFFLRIKYLDNSKPIEERQLSNPTHIYDFHTNQSGEIITVERKNNFQDLFFSFGFSQYDLSSQQVIRTDSLRFVGYKQVSNVIKHHDSWVFLLNKEKSGAMYLYNDGYERVFSRSFEDFAIWNINNVFFEEDGYIITGSRNGKAHVIKYPYNELLRYFYTSQKTVENQVVDIKVYPNPARSQFTVENTAGADKVKLFDLQGRLLWQQSIHSNSALIVPPSELNGMYVLQVLKDKLVLHNQKLLFIR